MAIKLSLAETISGELNDMASLTELSLFSGAGGGLLATKHLLGWKTICYVEWDRYAIEVLKARIRDGYLDDAPIWDDCFTFDGRPWAGLVDVVTAGFPCQPFSTAGKGLAENDPRNGWPAVIRILREVQPRYALLENVPGLLSKPYFRRILGELAQAGFNIEHDCISAEEIGANHKRERLWIVANSNQRTINVDEQSRSSVLDLARHGATQQVEHANDERCEKFNASQISDQSTLIDRGLVTVPYSDNPSTSRQREHSREVYARAETKRFDMGSSSLSDSNCEWPGERGSSIDDQQDGRCITGRQKENDFRQWWAVEPKLGRVANGVPHRLDRLKAIGNGQVPAVVAVAWERLTQ